MIILKCINMNSYKLLLIGMLLVTFTLLGCGGANDEIKKPQIKSISETKVTVKVNKPQPSHPLVDASLKQIGVTTSYDPSYVSLSFPNGDVPIKTGVCSDVIVRSLRTAYKMDLQKLINEDMIANFTQYPKIWGLKRPDKNIDHRRVPNIKTYLKRKGYALKLNAKIENYQPGDIVSCIIGKSTAHIYIVSSKKNPKGVPYIIHNIGSGAREEDAFLNFKITGHYRISK